MIAELQEENMITWEQLHLLGLSHSRALEYGWRVHQYIKQENSTRFR